MNKKPEHNDESWGCLLLAALLCLFWGLVGEIGFARTLLALAGITLAFLLVCGITSAFKRKQP